MVGRIAEKWCSECLTTALALFDLFEVKQEL